MGGGLVRCGSPPAAAENFFSAFAHQVALAGVEVELLLGDADKLRVAERQREWRRYDEPRSGIAQHMDLVRFRSQPGPAPRGSGSPQAPSPPLVAL